LEARPDVLVYTSEPLERDLEVMGPEEAELWVRSSLGHADFFARLCDVEPSVRSVNVSYALLRVSPGLPEHEADGHCTCGSSCGRRRTASKRGTE
jgi:uncharacterized protein